MLTIYVMYFNNKYLYILPTQFIYVLPMVLRIKGDYFPKEH
jgi:hypothetical protein